MRQNRLIQICKLFPEQQNFRQVHTWQINRGLHPFPSKPGFSPVCNRSLLKTL